MTALGDGAEAHGHLLDVVGDGDEQQQEPDEVVAVLRAGGRVRGDPAGVVVRNHDDDARPGDNQVQADRLPRLAQGIVELREKIHIRDLRDGFMCEKASARNPRG